MRALRSGDLLTIMFNRLKSYVELVLNLGEATHRFDVIVSSKTTIALNMPNNFVCGVGVPDKIHTFTQIFEYFLFSTYFVLR